MKEVREVVLIGSRGKRASAVGRCRLKEAAEVLGFRGRLNDSMGDGERKRKSIAMSICDVQKSIRWYRTINEFPKHRFDTGRSPSR